MTGKPRGRDSVRAALIQTGARLLAERGKAGISVREVAREAGVNHGLVHRHFGSKEGLLHQVMTSLAEEIAGAIGPPNPDESLSELLISTFGATSERLHWRILARSLLDGEDPRELQEDFPVVSRMLAAARRDSRSQLSPRALVTILLASGLGLLLFETYLKVATGQDEAQWQATRQELIALALGTGPQASQP